MKMLIENIIKNHHLPYETTTIENSALYRIFKPNISIHIYKNMVIIMGNRKTKYIPIEYQKVIEKYLLELLEEEEDE